MGTRMHSTSILSTWPCLVLILLSAFVSAQSSNSSVSQPSSSSVSLSTSLSLTTSEMAVPTTIRSGNSNIVTTTNIPVLLNATILVTPTPTATTNTSSATTSASASATPDPLRLDTKLDPAFGVLGALLILTGIPCTFYGHKNRWTTFFLSGFYTLSLVCLVLILKFGVLPSVNPPSKTVRGLFVLSCGVAGIAGGGVAIFFWKAAKFFIGAWGGFAFALWIQCFRDGGLIRPLGFRWIMYIAVAVVGFLLCTIPKLHYHILLISTAFVGASAFMLGVDCFTSADLKEFYLWNLGFNSLFPKYSDNGIEFPVTQTMQIELGLMGAVAVMGIAVQFRIFQVLKRKLTEIEAERKRQDEEAEARAAAAYADVEREKEEWERDHPTLTKDGRMNNGASSSGLLKEDDISSTPRDERRSSAFTLIGTPRQRYQSGVSDFRAVSTPTDEFDRASKHLQSPGALPVLDLGVDIEEDVPRNYLSDSKEPRDPKAKEVSAADLEDLRRKEELLAEIQTIRRSIDLLRTETPDHSSSSESRHPSFASRLTLSPDFGILAAGPSHLRPPREAEPRTRVQSMGLSNISRTSEGLGIGRPTSAPLQEEDWDSYVRDRKLLQPPSGVTAPIPTTPIAPIPRMPVSPAVTEALMDRQRRESMLSVGLGQITPDGSSTPRRISTPLFEDTPLPRPQHRKSNSQGAMPGMILPPRRAVVSPSPQPQAEQSPRVLSFEELQERHRQKLKELQAPVTQAQKERVELEAAKQRWERAKAREKEAVTKRQAEKAAEKRRKSGDMPERHSRRSGHGRSLSADVLAEVSGNVGPSKRTSKMKVQDWRKSQHDLELGLQTDDPADASASRRRSAVPFPNSKTS
ncbi:hypothetical protein CERSUDRAFT_110537 [Gelatoporia subvermispora B]|uniref:TM7S3/TM198-like domain-containing protein n=1 Tax=Ceriporiopsis subvermispora (strain B) TaxID=914234 RepID=M2RSU5_CERS8|nr:hypothetical protein CERSUDRAFT_110537 [Gelatoporia subvermispora B]